MNKESRTPGAQESRYLEATVKLFKDCFPEHPNVANDQGLRYLRQNLMQSVEYIGSAERLYRICSRLCADTTPRGLQTMTKFAASRNLASYLLGGLKRDLLTRFTAPSLEEAIPPSRAKASAAVSSPLRDHDEDEVDESDNEDDEDASGSDSEELECEDDPDDQEVNIDVWGRTYILKDGERIPYVEIDPDYGGDFEDVRFDCFGRGYLRRDSD